MLSIDFKRVASKFALGSFLLLSLQSVSFAECYWIPNIPPVPICFTDTEGTKIPNALRCKVENVSYNSFSLDTYAEHREYSFDNVCEFVEDPDADKIYSGEKSFDDFQSQLLWYHIIAHWDSKTNKAVMNFYKLNSPDDKAGNFPTLSFTYSCDHHDPWQSSSYNCKNTSTHSNDPGSVTGHMRDDFSDVAIEYTKKAIPKLRGIIMRQKTLVKSMHALPQPNPIYTPTGNVLLITTTATDIDIDPKWEMNFVVSKDEAQSIDAGSESFPQNNTEIIATKKAHVSKIGLNTYFLSNLKAGWYSYTNELLNILLPNKDYKKYGTQFVVIQKTLLGEPPAGPLGDPVDLEHPPAPYIVYPLNNEEVQGTHNFQLIIQKDPKRSVNIKLFHLETVTTTEHGNNGDVDYTYQTTKDVYEEFPMAPIETLSISDGTIQLYRYNLPKTGKWGLKAGYVNNSMSDMTYFTVSETNTSQEKMDTYTFTTETDVMLALYDHNFTITGEFGAYDFNSDGDYDPFDWAFTVTSNGKVYQLHGNEPTQNSVFGWKEVQIASPTPQWYMFPLNKDVDNDGSQKFDWVLVSPNNQAVYKLSGVSENGTFLYSKPLDINYTISEGVISF